MKQKVKKHDVLVAISAHHWDSEIASFLNVARSFVFKARHELETSGGYISRLAKWKKHSQRLDTIWTLDFIQQFREAVDEDPCKSILSIA